MDVQSILFQDAMDPSRFLRIVEEKPTRVLCKVYFGPDKNKLIYHGKVELSKRMFYPEGGTRIGFNPARDPVQPKPKVREYYDRDDED